MKSLAISCGCKARFVSDVVDNPEERFSRQEATIGCRKDGPTRGKKSVALKQNVIQKKDNCSKCNTK